MSPLRLYILLSANIYHFHNFLNTFAFQYYMPCQIVFTKAHSNAKCFPLSFCSSSSTRITIRPSTSTSALPPYRIQTPRITLLVVISLLHSSYMLDPLVILSYRASGPAQPFPTPLPSARFPDEMAHHFTYLGTPSLFSPALHFPTFSLTPQLPPSSPIRHSPHCHSAQHQPAG